MDCAASPPSLLTIYATSSLSVWTVQPVLSLYGLCSQFSLSTGYTCNQFSLCMDCAASSPSLLALPPVYSPLLLRPPFSLLLPSAILITNHLNNAKCFLRAPFYWPESHRHLQWPNIYLGYLTAIPLMSSHIHWDAGERRLQPTTSKFITMTNIVGYTDVKTKVVWILLSQLAAMSDGLVPPLQED